MFRDQLDTKLENPNDNEAGKKNIETMESLVESMTKSGDYVGVKKVKKIKKSK